MLSTKLSSSTASNQKWDITNMSYNGTPVNFIPTEGYSLFTSFGPTGLYIRSDGLKLYIIGSFGDVVQEYTLSTAWDLSTAVYIRPKSVSSQDSNPTGVFFKPDGTKMYIIGSTNDRVYEYDLSTAWDISTAVFSQNKSLTTVVTDPRGFFFKPDGTEMYVNDYLDRAIYKYELSTAWDISSLSTIRASFSFTGIADRPGGLFFSSDGTKMMVARYFSNLLYRYDLSTAWDITTASYVSNQSLPTGVITAFGCVFFDTTGDTLFVTGQDGRPLVRYDLSSSWDITSVSFTSPTTNYYDFVNEANSISGLMFRSDGLKMYITSWNGDNILEYNLSVAWDVTTLSYVQSFNVNAQEGIVEDVKFKPDGTKMYIIGASSDSVHEYDLSTAWDLSSTTFLQSFSVSAQDTQPRSLFFKPDGTKMYVGGDTNNRVYTYDLSTSWDISTAVSSSNKSVFGNTPQQLFFKDDGTRMYIADFVDSAVRQWELATPWEPTSATTNQAAVTVTLNSIVAEPRGLAFKDDGSMIYLMDHSTGLMLVFDV